MATQRDSARRSGPNDTIQCPLCGERYSVTYRRCPFCDEPAIKKRTAAAAGGSRSASSGSSRSGEPSSGRSTSGGGRSSSSGSSRSASSRSTSGDYSSGRRVARNNARGGGYGRSPQLNQIIFAVVTLAIIFGAIFVVYKTISPLLGRDDEESSSSSTLEGTNTGTDTDITTPSIPSVDTNVDQSETPVISSVTGIALSHSDVTLSASEPFTLIATIAPSDADATIVWTTDNDSALSVSLSGLVTNTNTSGSAQVVTVTATAGNVSASCVVRCKSSGTTSSTTTATSDGNATVVGASSGLNVRSGAGTTYDVVATLTNGSVVTVLSTPTDGWYQISYAGSGGTTQTGYVSSSYIAVG